MTLNRLLIARCISACLALAYFSGMVRAQAGQRMALVAPGIGWAILNQPSGFNLNIPNHRLFWTSDDGNTWKDITPQGPTSHEIAGAFFLDASRGWVLLALKREPPKNNQEPDNFITDIRGFDLASTTDGGASWTIKHLDSLPEGVGWLAASEIFFVDSAHGWMNIASPVPHWGGAGVLLATSDGGDTWKPIVEVNGGGGYGPIRFTDQQNGWIAGGPGDYYLYSTTDGGHHWKEASVAPPAAISGLFESVAAQYALPWFKDSKHGFLSAHYSGEAKSGEDISIQTLFATDNGGSVWHLESWGKLEATSNPPIVALVDSTAFAPKRVDHEPATLLKLGPQGKLTETRASKFPEIFSGAALSDLNFKDVTHGWASSSDGHLLSTADGGATWRDITPGRKKTSSLVPSNTVPSANSSGTLSQNSPVTSAIPATTAAASSITTYKSRHLGFDTCAAPASSTQMSTWWNSSPFFDVGIYVGGSSRSCQQPNLTSSWVKTVTGQGWGLIPLWPGPQAPCTNFIHTISTNGAYAQGQAEADLATKGSKGAMAKLGLGAGSVIYYDIENYTPSATCNGNPTGSYVNAFLSGWVSEVHNNGYIAGVYGNSAPALDWNTGGTGYGAVSPSPDDVFIANYNNANFNVQIWGLGVLPDSAWSQNQRMHQYVSGQNQTWGGLLINIDGDIEDADVTGGNGAKTYSFTYTTIDYPGALDTIFDAINNSGQIAGHYDSTAGPSHGFLYSNGSFTTFDYPNALSTFPYGINNAGEIVGQYTDMQGVSHGFRYLAGLFFSIDYPGAAATYVYGINDDEQISGYYTDSVGVAHGFEYQPSSPTPFTSFDYPLAPRTLAYGINGDAQIAGSCPDALAFLYAGGSFTNPPVECAVWVNNNEQIIGGGAVFEHEGSSILIPSQYGPWGLNDFTLNAQGQGTAKVAFVGVLSGGHGFLATSQ